MYEHHLLSTANSKAIPPRLHEILTACLERLGEGVLAQKDWHRERDALLSRKLIAFEATVNGRLNEL